MKPISSEIPRVVREDRNIKDLVVLISDAIISKEVTPMQAQWALAWAWESVLRHGVLTARKSQGKEND